jgi:hypothetical protein
MLGAGGEKRQAISRTFFLDLLFGKPATTGGRNKGKITEK